MGSGANATAEFHKTELQSLQVELPKYQSHKYYDTIEDQVNYKSIIQSS